MNILKTILFLVMLATTFLAVFSSVAANTDIQDIEPPVIVSAKLDPVVINTSDSPVTLTLTVHITDNLSGIARGYYRFVPANPQVNGQFVDAFTDKQDAVCTGSSTDMVCHIPFTLPRYSAGGDWVAMSISTYDTIGNSWSMAASPPQYLPPDTPGYVYFINDTEGTYFKNHIFLSAIMR